MTKMRAPSTTTRVTRKCHECGGKLVGTRQVYKYTECGLSNVRLRNVFVFECSCGVRVPEIPAISELHCIIALALLKKSSLLSGEEVRFLRKMAGLSQRELAEIMGVAPTRPSKWENGSTGKESDRLLRTICLLGMIQNMGADKGMGVIQALAGQVRQVLKSIEDRADGPKKLDLQCESDPATATNDVWFVPSPGGSRLPLH